MADAKKRRHGSIIGEITGAGDLLLVTSHTPSNAMRVERADVDDLAAVVRDLGLLPLELRVGAASRQLAQFIIDWLESRNGGELSGPLGDQTVGDRQLMLDELGLILKCGGKPPNWT